MKVFLSACLLFSALIGYSQPVLRVSVGSTEIQSGTTNFSIGDAYVNSTATTHFLLENTGDDDLEFDLLEPIVVSGANIDQFAVEGVLQGLSLAAGDKTYFTINFNPTATGVKSIAVTLQSNVANFVFDVSANGITELNNCEIPAFNFENFQNLSVVHGFFGAEGTVAYQMPSGWQSLFGLLGAIISGNPINVRSTVDGRTGMAAEFFSNGGGSADAFTILNCDNMYTSLKGYYKFTGAEDDDAEITISTGGDNLDNHTLTNSNSIIISDNAGTYTEFEIPIEYDAQSTNTLYISISSSGFGPATSLKIDDLSLHGVLAAGVPATPAAPYFTAQTATGATVNWSAPYASGAPIVSYTLQRKDGVGGSFSNVYTGANLSYNVTGLTEGNSYFFRVLATNSEGSSDFSDEAELVPDDIISMTNGTFAVCEGVFTDSGFGGDYGNNEDFELTLEPSEPGKRIRVTFSELSLELGEDYLMVYNGTSSASPLMASLTGSSTPTVTASGPDGALTFQFSSSGSGVASGWEATISCLNPEPPAKPAPVTFGAITSSSAVVNWTAPNNNGSAITSYTLEQKQGVAGSYAVIYNGLNLTHTATGLTIGETYYFRLKATNAIGDSEYSNETQVVPQNLLQMSDGAVSSCGSAFTDSGGLASNYSSNEDFTLTISPSEAGKKVRVSFSSFDLESGYDFLSIYDGADQSSPLAEDLTGTTLPGTFTSSSSNGALTFRFSSDDIFNKPGWVGSISCISPGPPAKPSAVTFGSTTATSVVINWSAPSDNGAAITSYTLQQKTGSGGSYSTIFTGNSLTHTATGLTTGQSYFFRVKATNAEGDSEYSEEAEVTPANSILMANGTIVACGGTFTDSGGASGNYEDDEEYTLTIEPAEPGKKVRVTFSEFGTEELFDFLQIHNGATIGAPEIVKLTGTPILSTHTASNPEGKLTFYFKSDGSIQGSGWLATISCVSPPAQPQPVTFSNVTTSSATINWTAPANNGFAITEYSLEQKEGAGGTYAEVYSGMNLSYNANSLTTGATYFFRVRATNSIGDSEFSTEASVVPQSPPVLQTNAGQIVNEGDNAIIPTVKLQTTDGDNVAGEITYKLTVLPANGTVQKNGTNLALNNTFTQQDINNNLIRYAHNGSETTSDSFKFTVTDGTTTLPEATFAITIEPTNDVPELITNTGISVITGISKAITTTMLQGTDPDHSASELTYIIRILPAKGTLKKNDVAVVTDGTFTQQDIDNGLISYLTTQSQAGTDKFQFDFSDGFVSFTNREFNINIMLSAVQPVLVTNSGLTLDEGATLSLEGKLLATDQDNTPAEVEFTLNSFLINGKLMKGDVALTRFDKFTQADITAGLIKYSHFGTETTSDSFSFFVSDGQFQLPEEVFNITITPVNDPPILAENTTQTLNERESTIIRNLSTSDLDNTSDEIIYTLKATPQFGILKLVEEVLEVGDTFSQSDIYDNKLSYTHTGTEVGSDSFKFTVSDGAFTLAEAVFNFTITDIPLFPQTITFSPLTDKTEGDPDFTIVASASSNLEVVFSVVSGPATVAGNKVVLTGAGLITIKASQPGNNIYSAAPDVIRSFCSNPRRPTITMQGADTESPTLVSSANEGNQWFKDGLPIFDATTASLLVTEVGDYSVQVTIGDCISAMSSNFAVVVTGDLRRPTGITLYPNPATDNVHVRGISQTVSRVYALGVTGQPIERPFVQQDETIQVSVEDIAPGFYVLNLESTNSNQRIKFIKK